MGGAGMANEALTAHLGFIAGLPGPALAQFCGIAIDFISHGPNRSKFAKAAESLGTSVDEVTNGVDALAHLFCIAAKDALGPKGFAAVIRPHGFSEEATKTLFQVHVGHQANIRKILKDMESSAPHYENMHWRLDVQVASKSVRNTVEPTFLMRIDTNDAKGSQSHHLEADFANLDHLHQELSEALKASTQPQYNRVSRAATR